jgi:hypothetical protein
VTEGFAVRLMRAVASPELLERGGRLVALPRAEEAHRTEIDVATLIEEKRERLSAHTVYREERRLSHARPCRAASDRQHLGPSPPGHRPTPPPSRPAAHAAIRSASTSCSTPAETASFASASRSACAAPRLRRCRSASAYRRGRSSRSDHAAIPARPEAFSREMPPALSAATLAPPQLGEGLCRTRRSLLADDPGLPGLRPPARACGLWRAPHVKPKGYPSGIWPAASGLPSALWPPGGAAQLTGNGLRRHYIAIAPGSALDDALTFLKNPGNFRLGQKTLPDKKRS